MKTAKLQRGKKASAARRFRSRLQRVVRERIVRECADAVPTTWLDDLLTGPSAVLKGNGGTWGCPDIEALCKGIKARILALSNDEVSGRSVGRSNT